MTNTRKFWTGVGTTEPTQDEYDLMVLIGQRMAEKGYILRSGRAIGSDAAFEEGVCRVDPALTEIWLPWRSYNEEDQHPDAHYFVPTQAQIDAARRFYTEETDILSWFDRMKQGSQKMHGRNYFQVVGHQGDDPLSHLCIYCADENEKREVKGGTRSAVMISRHYERPTANIRIPVQRDKLIELLKL